LGFVIAINQNSIGVNTQEKCNVWNLINTWNMLSAPSFGGFSLQEGYLHCEKKAFGEVNVERKRFR